MTPEKGLKPIIGAKERLALNVCAKIAHILVGARLGILRQAEIPLVLKRMSR